MKHNNAYVKNEELIAAALSHIVKYGWGVSNGHRKIAPVKSLIKKLKENSEITVAQSIALYISGKSKVPVPNTLNESDIIIIVCSMLELLEYGNHSDSMREAVLDVISLFDPVRAKFIALEHYAEMLGFGLSSADVPDDCVAFVLQGARLELV